MKIPLLHSKEARGVSWNQAIANIFIFTTILIFIFFTFDRRRQNLFNSEISIGMQAGSSESANESREDLSKTFDELKIDPSGVDPLDPRWSPSLSSAPGVQRETFQLPGHLQIPGSRDGSSRSSNSRSDLGEEEMQSRRPERFNREGKALLLSPTVLSNADALKWDQRKLPLPPKSKPISEPSALIPWETLSEFRTPVKGGKNLFVAWLGTHPPPMIHAFVHSMFRNKGEFTFHLITSDNLKRYMSLVVDGKQICPDIDTRLPNETHIDYKVWFRIWSTTTADLPLATRKDFVVNVMIALFGGAFMDPGLLGLGKLDYWWDEVMQKENIDYINYSFGDEWDIGAGARHLSAAIDKEGRGKWSGQLWIDVFFTMVKADAPIMQTYLYYIHSESDWGPSKTQANNSPYFIYGGDVLDACFNSVYDWLDRKPFHENKLGVIKYDPIPQGTPPSSGYNSDDEFIPSAFFDELDETLPPRDFNEVVNLFEELDRAFSRAPPPPGHKDPPTGVMLKDANIQETGQSAIMFNMRHWDNRFSATQIPQPQYQYFSTPLYPDFRSMIVAGHPGALNARAVMDTLSAPEGGIYIKFYGTGEELKYLSWEQLCGPPRSIIMFMIQSVTGEDMCTGEKVPLISPSEKWFRPEGKPPAAASSSKSRTPPKAPVPS